MAASSTPTASFKLKICLSFSLFSLLLLRGLLSQVAAVAELERQARGGPMEPQEIPELKALRVRTPAYKALRALLEPKDLRAIKA